LRRWWLKGQGFLEIEIKGLAVERFLNLAVQNSIDLQNIRFVAKDKVICLMALKDVHFLRPLARKSRCRIHIRKRLGLPFFWRRLQKRKMLVIGCIVFCLLFYIAGHIALEVQITGPEPINAIQAQQIKELAQDKGIDKGKLIWHMDFDAAKKYIMLKDPTLAFVNISSQGNKIIIKAVKRTEVAADEKSLPPGNIVAKEDGVIQDILVTKGEAMVKAGDTVSAGQMLILGYDDSGPVAASGIVRAHCWYQGYGECLMYETGYKNSGSHFTQIQFVWRDEVQLIAGGPAVPDYDCFSQTTQVIPLIIWRNITLPVEIVKKDFREQIPYQIQRSEEDAEEKAVSAAENMAMRELPLNAEILDKKITLLADNEEIKKAKMLIEARIDLGQYRPYNVNANHEQYKRLQQEKKAQRNSP
jgi:similar to stage IV sporulation protein